MLIANETINPNETKFTSHIGVYGIILSMNKTKILVMKKRRGPYTGLYDLPGGSIEPHELFEEALEREVYEETGCAAGSYSQVEAVSVRYPYQDNGELACFRHMGVLYKMELFGEPNAGDGSEGDRVKWMSCTDLDDTNASPFVVRAVELVKKGRI